MSTIIYAIQIFIQHIQISAFATICHNYRNENKAYIIHTFLFFEKQTHPESRINAQLILAPWFIFYGRPQQTLYKNDTYFNFLRTILLRTNISAEHLLLNITTLSHTQTLRYISNINIVTVHKSTEQTLSFITWCNHTIIII